MSLLIFDMPDEPQQLRTWLEQQLAGVRLRQVVSELTGVHGPEETRLTLDEACGSELSNILKHGMANTSSDIIRRLLTHPRLLLELQDRISLDGGEYWLDVPISDEHQSAVDRGWERLHAEFPELSTTGGLDKAAAAPNTSATTQPTKTAASSTDVWGNPRQSSRRLIVRVAFVTCGLLLAVGIGVLLRPAPVGWDSPGRLTADRSPSQVFSELAEASTSYIESSRSTPEELEREIERFIHDCQQVQNLDLPDLAAIKHPDRDAPDSGISTYADWLRIKCKAWEDKANGVLTAFRDGSIDQATADAQYTEIVKKLKVALEKQAAALA